LLNEAIKALHDLNSNADASDSYPIVTLAEGHISVLLKFFGVEGSKVVAQKYSNELLVAFKKHPSARLDDAVKKFVTFSTSGVWKNSYGTEDLSEI
jgi:ABC-type hemin transport system ATPase subunit